MKGKKVSELLRKKTVRIGCLAMAAVIAAGGYWAATRESSAVPELVTFVDTEGSVAISEDEVPLGVPKVTTSTKTKKKTKKIKLKKASAKTYKKQGKTTTKKQTKKTEAGDETTTTVTETATTVLNQYKKGSNVNTQVTTTKTTVTKTVISQQSEVVRQATASTGGTGTVPTAAMASQADARVLNAFNKLGFTININPGVSYSGLFDARTRSITLKRADTTVYHELGHFLAFIAGNYDMTAEFKAIYNREKANYTAFNKSYVLSSSSEYFAESFKNYTMEPAQLQASRPETYQAIQTALSRITEAQVSKVWNVYKAVWEK